MPPEPAAQPAPVPERPEVSAVVPTLGRSPWLGVCLEALRQQRGVRSLEIVVVDQAPRPLALPAGLADRVLRLERNLGFAGGTNLGIAAAAGELVATVNDDAVVGPGWLATLAAALRADPGAAAVQGMNVLAEEPGADSTPAARPDRSARADRQGPSDRPDLAGSTGRIDGCGLGWNRWWQAIQLGHGEPAPPPPAIEAAGSSGIGGTSAAPGGGTSGTGRLASGLGVASVSGTGRSGVLEIAEGSRSGGAVGAVEGGERSGSSRTAAALEVADMSGIAGIAAVPVAEVFGVSATAALYRRSALDQVALRGGEVFDSRLVSYYEDAELAGRLRAAGFRALLAPAARARHAASASARAAPASRERWRLIYGNRYLAAARLLGRGLWPRLPLMLLRDFLDAINAITAIDASSLLARAGARRDRAAASGGFVHAAGRRERLAGMLAGWRRALRHLPAFVRLGPPVPPAAEVARLSRWPAQPR
jgi:GT2 family glycosyltransferase